MNTLPDEPQSHLGLWALFKNALRRLFSPKWIPPQPDPPKSAQDYRDQALNKCPWKDFW